MSGSLPSKMRGLALQQRKAALLRKTGDDTLRLSQSFESGEELLAATAQQDLEGIVSKRRESVYVAGPNCGWIKVKMAEWSEANRERYKLFEKT